MKKTDEKLKEDIWNVGKKVITKPYDFISNVSMSDPNTQVVDTRTGEIIKPYGVTITKT